MLGGGNPVGGSNPAGTADSQRLQRGIGPSHWCKLRVFLVHHATNVEHCNSTTIFTLRFYNANLFSLIASDKEIIKIFFYKCF